MQASAGSREELAVEGVSVMICARGEERLTETRESMIKAFGPRMVAVSADLSDPVEIGRVGGGSLGSQEFGRMDILVTNVDSSPAGRFEDLSSESWEAAGGRLLLQSVLNLTRAVLPGMKEPGWSHILNVTSVTVKQPEDNSFCPIVCAGRSRISPERWPLKLSPMTSPSTTFFRVIQRLSVFKDSSHESQQSVQ